MSTWSKIAVPVIVHPGGARPAAAVDHEFDTTGDQTIVAGRFVRPGKRPHTLRQRLRVAQVSPAAPQDEYPDREVAIGEHVGVRVPGCLPDAGVLHPGHALGVEGLRQVAHAFAHLLGAHRWNQTVDQPLGALLQHARGVAVGVVIDGAAGRIRGVAGNAGKLHRQAVGGAIVPHGVRQPHGVVGSDRVEVGCGDVAQLLELALVPATAADPVAGLGLRDTLGDLVDHIGDRSHTWVTEIEYEHARGAAVAEVSVSVEQPRRCRPATEIDPAGGYTDQCVDLGARADRDDATVLHRNGLGNAIGGVDGDDLAVDQRDVGRLFCRRPAATTRSQRHANNRDHATAAAPRSLVHRVASFVWVRAP